MSISSPPLMIPTLVLTVTPCACTATNLLQYQQTPPCHPSSHFFLEAELSLKRGNSHCYQWKDIWLHTIALYAYH